jgi:hypothetical protein
VKHEIYEPTNTTRRGTRPERKINGAGAVPEMFLLILVLQIYRTTFRLPQILLLRKSMKTIITIKAKSRPGYFNYVVSYLQNLPGIEEYPIVVSLDFDSQQEAHIRAVQACSNVANYHILKNGAPRGCAGNTRLLMEHAFETEKADYVIHLEDDTVPARDFLQYMQWGFKELTNNPELFAVCPFNRANKKFEIPCDPTVDTSYLKPWFECGGGFGIERTTWDYIQDNGGMFGAVGNTNNPDVVGLPWKYSQSIMITDDGSWAWPFNQFFRERSDTEHLCIFPTISRTNNIGAEGGRFNPSAEWHQKNIWDPVWIGAEQYDNTNLLNLDYKFV